MKNDQNNRESEKDTILSSDQIDLDIQSDASLKKRLRSYLQSMDDLSNSKTNHNA